MAAIFLSIFFLLEIFSFSTLAKGKCKTSHPLKLENLNSASDILLYAEKNNLTTVDDLVCCLPEEYLKNYIVGISSVAGQNGTPDSPRIIMFDRTDQIKSGSHNDQSKQPPPNFMLSFNGGKGHNSQPNSIEIAQYNKKKGELEFLDLSFNKSVRKLSAINPTDCMLCHGEITKNNDVVVPYGGPKYIFDPFAQWPRFAGGIQICENNIKENTLHNIYSDKAVEVIKKEHRYRCLDKNQLEFNRDSQLPAHRYPKLFGNLAAFENSNLPQEQDRQSKWLRGLPEFEKYKYFLLGFYYCADSGSADLEEWFPEEHAKKLLKKIKIDPRLKEEGNLHQNFSKAKAEEWQKNLDKQAYQENEIKKPDFSKGFSPNYSSMACKKEIPKEDFFGFDESDFQNKNFMLLGMMDNFIHKSPGPGGADTLHRLFLDGEEYGIGMISTVMVSTNGQILRSGASITVANEPESSKIKKMFKQIQPSDIMKTRDFYTDNKDFYKPNGTKEAVCKELKSLSMEQFKDPQAVPSSGESKQNKDGIGTR
ncbi:MAG: hypothetical protein ACXVCP_06220 [Bdellovibrio sp.]